jgi:TonB-linked SusC/RagA family outer membrane protein
MKIYQVIKSDERQWTKVLRIAKLTVIMLFCSLMALNASTSSPKTSSSDDPGMQQERKITGKVTDISGSALPGVSVLVQGTTIGTLTDVNGNYTLTLPSGAKTLMFSFVGMKSQEIAIGAQTMINLTLSESAIGLEEVVVVGYGTQKKANLTGSVGSVSGAEIVKRPATNVQNLLEGKVSGLQIVQRGGEPGNDVGTMRIRGIGTFSSAGSDPLVLIDGIPGNMSYLNPDDVESVSVLKDAASASIYGSRAANGVILITTKRGTANKLSITYHAEVGMQNPTRLPDLDWNSVDYMTNWNTANLRAGMVAYFSQADIDAYKNNVNDPVHYPNYNWIDHCYKTGIQQTHDIDVNGGNDKTQFTMSLGYLDQSAVVRLFHFDRYNMHMGIDSKVTDWLKIGGTFRALKSKKIADVQSPYSETYYIMHTFAPMPLCTPTMVLPDGTIGYTARYSAAIAEWTVRNPDAMLAQGDNQQDRYNMEPQVYAEVQLTKDLTWYTKGAVLFDTYSTMNHESAINCYYMKDGTFAHNGAPWHLGTMEDWYSTFNTTLYSTLNYKKTIAGNHNINILAGFNQETSLYRTVGASRITYTIPNLYEINAGSATGQTTRGTASQWDIQSLFGRVNYNFKGKYLLEGDIRYDGTSRIAPATRWGLFPSVSAGWRLSEESFMKPITWLSDLKFRGSWGQLGNQNVGNYPYQDILGNSQYSFGSSLQPGVQLTRLVDKTLQWETTTLTDVGLDLSIKKGLLSATIDYYDKITSGILYSIPVPASIGLSAPTVNGGKMENKGWDLELGHANQIGEFRYKITVDWATYKNKVLSILSPTLATNTVQVGIPYNSWYMVQWIGIFQNQAQIDAAPKHQFNPKPGDLIFRDANGDGKIDANDRVVVKGYYPDFYYSFGGNVGWKNFDFSVFFNGVHGIKDYANNWGLTPFTQGSAPTMDLVKNQWTGEGSTNTYPAMYRSGYNPVTGTTSTFNLFDASYLRLKSLRLGYTIPVEFAKKIGMQDAQVYFSGENVLTFTKFPGIDPERTSQNSALSLYPNVRTLAFGIKVTL